MSVYAGAGIGPASDEQCVGIGTNQGAPKAPEGLGGTCCTPAGARSPQELGGIQGPDDSSGRPDLVGVGANAECW